MIYKQLPREFSWETMNQFKSIYNSFSWGTFLLFFVSLFFFITNRTDLAFWASSLASIDWTQSQQKLYALLKKNHVNVAQLFSHRPRFPFRQNRNIARFPLRYLLSQSLILHFQCGKNAEKQTNNFQF